MIEDLSNRAQSEAEDVQELVKEKQALRSKLEEYQKNSNTDKFDWPSKVNFLQEQLVKYQSIIEEKSESIEFLKQQAKRANSDRDNLALENDELKRDFET